MNCEACGCLCPCVCDCPTCCAPPQDDVPFGMHETNLAPWEQPYAVALDEVRCQVQNLDGTEACREEPRFILEWARESITVSATLCSECGITWIHRLTRQGKNVLVRPAVRQVLRV